MARKTTKKKTRFDEQSYMHEVANSNIVAIQQGPKRKSWSIHDLRAIKPLTTKQASLIESYFTGNHLVASGSAGTGKSFLALWLALTSVLTKDSPEDHIIIVRSAVASRDIGFLPGTAEEKLEPFEVPYKDIMHDLLGRATSYDDLKDAGKVKFIPTSFVRGSTWDNAVVIIDEAQNLTMHELNSVITRVGENTRVIVCGDYNQNDLVNKRYETSGFKDFLRVADAMHDFDVVNFTKDDIVRSEFVKAWISTLEDLGL
jgi:phosphate starvation-inducible PhoH-like protein